MSGTDAGKRPAHPLRQWDLGGILGKPGVGRGRLGSRGRCNGPDIDRGRAFRALADLVLDLLAGNEPRSTILDASLDAALVDIDAVAAAVRLYPTEPVTLGPRFNCTRRHQKPHVCTRSIEVPPLI